MSDVTVESMGIAVLTRGSVSDDDIDYGIHRVSAVLRSLDEPILFARLTLDFAGDPARPRPALAQTTVDVNGDILRAHVAGHTVREAVDLLQRRLADKLEQRRQHRDALRTRSAEHAPGEWRHGDLPDVRPGYFDRPVAERELVRHKTFAIGELTVDEAAFDMEQLDYGFFLFRELASGDDALLERTDDRGYRLTRLHPAAVGVGPAAVALTVADIAPPVQTVAEAIERLDADDEPFVFFASAATGRGNVVYRRYDGHYGLITPA